MRFVLKQNGCGSERIGYLTGFVKSSGATIETPTSALLTQGGSVVNLTADVLSRVFTNPQLLWVPLSNSIQLEMGLKTQGEGVAKFSGLTKHITCITLHSMSEVTPAGHFEQDRVPLWTKNGKKMISANRYMDLMEVYKPDIILAIADSRTSLCEGPKRINKSVERSNFLLDLCIDRYKASKQLQNSSLIGVIVGAGIPKKCEESLEHILKYKDYISGVVLAGLTDGTKESMEVSTEVLDDIFNKVDEAIPKDLLRIIEGSWNPAVIMAAIDHGWDVFDGSYPLKLTNVGQALALNLEVNRSSTELCILNLSDIRYKEDFRPILEDCECLACKKHTRAYIRHLLNTREMLSNVLLSIHNLHHFDQLFLHARRHIKAKTYNIYKEHITSQYKMYTDCTKCTLVLNGKEENLDIVPNGHTSKVPLENGVDGENEIIQLKKKIRVSNNVNNFVVTNGTRM